MDDTRADNAVDTLACAVVQLCSTQDVEANLRTASRFIREAAAAGAQWVATPENTAFLRTDPTAPAPAQALDGPIVSRLREVAREARVWLLVGSMQEAVPGEAQRYANTSVVIDGTSPDAPITCTYRKLHLFDIDIKGGESQRESDWIVRGDEIVCTPVAGVQTGLTICYDLRFPTLYQTLVDRGARILTVPAAFTEFTGKDHWLPLLRARAIETQCFVVAPNQGGHHGGKRRSYGKSAIIDPWGITLAVAPDGPGWVMARLDLAQQDRIRASLPCHSHRHPNV
ncbi:MAG: carbon-nitrogen hydrolase family protein [Myxococcota bacterium]|jgi:predicted amidohydrolase|nr:carbon-nitrogen hydrolase family protein [Myxococcota bacterium]